MRWGLLALVACADPPAAAPRPPLDTAVTVGPEVRIEPSAPSARQALTCVVDRPGSYWVEWTVDGEPFVGDGSTHPGDTVPSGVTDAGQTWVCEAFPTTIGASGAATVTVAEPLGGNVLLVVLDGVGPDRIGVYAAHPRPALTPTIDRLAADGVWFTRAYGAPTASAGRAALLTGRHGRRTGIGQDVVPDGGFALRVDERLLPEVLALAATPWATSAVGRWALAPATDLEHPNAQGFAWFAGVLDGIDDGPGDGRPLGYDHWGQVVNGTRGFVDAYATTAQIDAAAARLDAMAEPWLLYLAPSAPGAPLHAPPPHLRPGSPDPLDGDAARFGAMLEAVDTELGRLLDGIDPAVRDRTTVIVTADRGTDAAGVRRPSDAAEAPPSLLDAGVRVPLVVAGPHVAEPGRATDALVHLVDVLPTVAELAGVFPDRILDDAGAVVPLDGQSLVPLLTDPDAAWGRQSVYVERFGPNGRPPYLDDDVRSTRDAGWALVRGADGDALYPDGSDGQGADVLGAPLDDAAERAYYFLSRELDRYGAELRFANGE